MNKETGTCKRCGRDLSAHASVERGIGPVCVNKEGDEVSDIQTSLFENSFIHNFKGLGGCRSQCQVDLIKEQEHTIVIFTDLGVGTSVTNMSEQLATEIIHKLGLDPTKTLFAERYRHGDHDTIDQIQYRWDGRKFSSPQWRPLAGSYRNLIDQN